MSRYNKVAASALIAALAVPVGLVIAAEQAQVQTQEQAQVQQQEQFVYGSQLMTPEERAAYRAKMRAAKTVEEREQIRKEHHEAMKLRAKERGVTLPEEPPPMGGGRGSGGGRGLAP